MSNKELATVLKIDMKYIVLSIIDTTEPMPETVCIASCTNCKLM